MNEKGSGAQTGHDRLGKESGLSEWISRQGSRISDIHHDAGLRGSGCPKNMTRTNF